LKLRAGLADERGLASVEATILLATLGAGLLAMGVVAGPAIRDYADRLTVLVAEARCLAAADAAAPLPTACTAPGP
jgi:hypothetical protein